MKEDSKISPWLLNYCFSSGERHDKHVLYPPSSLKAVQLYSLSCLSMQNVSFLPGLDLGIFNLRARDESPSGFEARRFFNLTSSVSWLCEPETSERHWASSYHRKTFDTRGKMVKRVNVSLFCKILLINLYFLFVILCLLWTTSRLRTLIKVLRWAFSVEFVS